MCQEETRGLRHSMGPWFGAAHPVGQAHDCKCKGEARALTQRGVGLASLPASTAPQKHTVKSGVHPAELFTAVQPSLARHP